MIDEPIRQASDQFALAERPDEAIDLYCRLSEETKNAVGRAFLQLSPDPESSIFFFAAFYNQSLGRPQFTNDGLAYLGAKWWQYALFHRQVVDRSPLMELERLLERISQSHALCGWSDDVDRLPEWIDNGATGPPPLNDQHGVMTQRVVARMSAIRAFTGGWIYGYTWGNYFLTDAQLRQVPSGDQTRAYLEQARQSRPSFEGL
jgi:hypothetical protein